MIFRQAEWDKVEFKQYSRMCVLLKSQAAKTKHDLKIAASKIKFVKFSDISFSFKSEIAYFAKLPQAFESRLKSNTRYTGNVFIERVLFCTILRIGFQNWLAYKTS